MAERISIVLERATTQIPWGMSFEPRNRKLITVAVRGGTPADLCGVKKNDEFIEIDGAPPLSYEHGLSLLKETCRVEVEISRGTSDSSENGRVSTTGPPVPSAAVPTPQPAPSCATTIERCIWQPPSFDPSEKGGVPTCPLDVTDGEKRTVENLLAEAAAKSKRSAGIPVKTQKPIQRGQVDPSRVKSAEQLAQQDKAQMEFFLECFCRPLMSNGQDDEETAGRKRPRDDV